MPRPVPDGFPTDEELDAMEMESLAKAVAEADADPRSVRTRSFASE